MIKRFSLLFNAELRRHMEQDRGFRSCLGIQEALRCAHAVLAMYVDPSHSSSYVPIDRNAGLTKFFDGHHGEYDRMVACFKRAARMQALLIQLHPEVVCLKVLFFDKGQKQDFAYVEFQFHVKDGRTMSTGTRLSGNMISS